MAYQALLGSTVLGKSGDVPVSSLEGKILGIYFSAHWCPPCRGFTPVLAQFYNHVKDKMNIVFVSSDKDEHQFKEYYNEHPWLALPFKERDLKNKLSRQFKVDGIPTFVLLNPDGTVLTRNGRGIVDSDKEGAKFPWSHINANVLEILGDGPITANDGTTFTAAKLKTPGSYFGIYFSAHWCPPCRAFTPKFAEVYKKVVDAGKPLTVIFASWDRDKSQFDEYFHEMPWATLPFQDPRIEQLAGRFEVEGIPTLIMFDSNGTIVNEKAVGVVGGDPTGEEFPWVHKPIARVAAMNPNEDVIDAINSKVCVLLNTNGASSEVDTAKEIFTAFGNSYANPEVQFFLSGDSDFLQRVAGHLSIAATVAKPTVSIFNIPAGKQKDTLSGELSAASLKSFVEAFLTK